MPRRMPLAMDGLGKVIQFARVGAQQVTMDLKSDAHHVLLAPSSRKYFGFWCHAVVRYLRTFDFPALTWIDNSTSITGACSRRFKPRVEQRKAALKTVHLALSVFARVVTSCPSASGS